MPPNADGLDRLDNMAQQRRKRDVPNPKRGPVEQQPAVVEQHQEQPNSAPTEPEPTVAPEPVAAPPATRGLRRTPRSRRNSGRRIEWTDNAKAARSALTTYVAQLRKLAERERDATKAARKLDAETLRVVVERVAADNDVSYETVARAAGIDPQ